MGYKVLVTINLPNVTTQEREVFYEVLRIENWIKITNLDTAWKISFKDGGTRIGAINRIEADLKKAKEKSRIKKLYYAMQLDINELTINNL
jgi:hypothetical protein